jgi:hypothetical protein
MKKNKVKIKVKECKCDCLCCKVVPKPWDILILLFAMVLIFYVFTKMAI